MVVAHPAQQRRVITGAALTIEFGAVAGGEDGDLGQVEVPTHVAQGVRQLVARERDAFAQFHRRGDVIESEREQAHFAQGLSDPGADMITQSSARGLARAHASRWLGMLVLTACAVAGCASAPSENGVGPSSVEAVPVPVNEPQWQLLEPAPTTVGPAFERDTL